MVEDGCGLSHGSLVALSNDGSINGVKNGWRCKFNEPSRQQRRGTFQIFLNFELRGEVLLRLGGIFEFQNLGVRGSK
ncbi:hypothetical protein Csa_005141 [Cucumis sativus]|uniref:Uncharacterized protein n=1 Tax=Cucumis sativus TaxID=3659 RepID=A0A0A0KDM2_CUCSA|nr:hypothetical protein Csa_005141 [Cucumis sativus]